MVTFKLPLTWIITHSSRPSSQQFWNREQKLAKAYCFSMEWQIAIDLDYCSFFEALLPEVLERRAKVS